MELVKKFGVSLRSVHGDSSSFYVHGEYASEEEESSEETKTKDEEPEFVPIEITHGYSRDHRPDLKQFTLNLVTSSDGDIPLGLRVGNGNEVDTEVLVPFLKQWQESWEELEGQSPQVLAGDAALYTKENLGILGTLPWITRVPASLKEAKTLMHTHPQDQLQTFANPRLGEYQFSTFHSNYGEVPQRWILVESKARRQADLKALEKKLKEQTQKQQKALTQLCAQEFACEADAQHAVQAFEKKLTLHQLEQITVETKPHFSKPGRPSKDEQPSHYTFYLSAQLKPNEDVVQLHRNQAGRFIVATNILNDQAWSPEQVLLEYKDQTCERGFRFLKDPLFFVSRFFLKSRKRIMVLMMIMALALMVYALGQRQVRQALTKAEATVPDQKGKPTTRPTLRWLFQCFLSVHLVKLQGYPPLVKLNDVQRHILKFFSPNCQKYYLLS